MTYLTLYSFFPVCTPGEYYTMPDNPCKDCKCGSDGQPTNDCSEIMCDMIACPEGQRVKYIPGTCCGQECVPGRLSMYIDFYP